ncbi:MAG TPA: hypothetical protein HA283_01125 [Nanoarchaeota archaeon]|nr:hypothetical protein [Nanoarchaeota archaeon]HIH62874.1 hypothetical protein [Nanoarchaeota archaeon]HIJ10291.1 hypothetical protein [Nanoarchaeota archaeon]
MKKFEGWPIYQRIIEISKTMCQCKNCRNIRQFAQDIESVSYATEEEMITALIKKHPELKPERQAIIIIINPFGDLPNTYDNGDKKS